MTTPSPSGPAIGLIGAERGFGVAVPQDRHRCQQHVGHCHARTCRPPTCLSPGNNPAGTPVRRCIRGVRVQRLALLLRCHGVPLRPRLPAWCRWRLDGVGRIHQYRVWRRIERSRTSASTMRKRSTRTTSATASTGGILHQRLLHAAELRLRSCSRSPKSMLLHNPGGLLTPNPISPHRDAGRIPELQPGRGSTCEHHRLVRRPVARVRRYGCLRRCRPDHCRETVSGSGTMLPTAYNYNGSKLRGTTGISPGFWYATTPTTELPDSRMRPPGRMIMLQRTVFVTCVNNLGGKGTASGMPPQRGST
jgi:hypothetical protein